VAFLDWRDDQAALERDAERRRTEEKRAKIFRENAIPSDPEQSLPRVGSGTSVLEIQTTELRSDEGDKKTCEAKKRRGDDAARIAHIDTSVASSSGARNWVHKLKGGTCALTALPHLGTNRTFDLIIGSDLLYDSTHCAPLAACLARRLEKTQKARAHVVLAVRRGALIARLCVCARNRWGLRFRGARAGCVRGGERAFGEASRRAHRARGDAGRRGVAGAGGRDVRVGGGAASFLFVVDF